MENHIDITFDLETCSLSPNAAVMQIAAVAWDRDKRIEDKSPFFLDRSFVFKRNVDLRSCVTAGFHFDMNTIQWWSGQSAKTKYMVEGGDAEDIYKVFKDFFSWILSVKEEIKANTVCLWCQGADFDLAILRNICMRYSLQCPVGHHCFRDCRTYVTELMSLYDGTMDFKDYDKLYNFYIPQFAIENAAIEDIEEVPHEPLYDAMRSTWYVWYAMCLNRP